MKSSFDKRQIILNYIRHNGSVSRQDIAGMFGLNVATAGNIINRLIAKGIIAEVNDLDKNIKRAGRPKVILQINPDAAYYIGINFNSDELNVGIVDFSGRLLVHLSREFPAKVNRNDVIGEIFNLTEKIISKNIWVKEKLIAIGVGAPGKVEPVNGIALEYSRIKQWHNVPLRDLIEVHFSLPTFLDSVNNSFALGEVFAGNAMDYSNIAMIMIRTGVSMGLIQDRKVYNSNQPGAGELGHTIVDTYGKCWCGRKGCLETKVSGWILKSKIKKAAIQGKNSFWQEKIKSKAKITPEEVCHVANEGDSLAIQVLEEMFEHLARAISNIHQILNLDAYVIHGRFNAAREIIGNIIQDYLKNNHSDIEWSPPKIIIPEKSRDVGLCGAAMLAVNKVPLWPVRGDDIANFHSARANNRKYRKVLEQV